MNAHSLTLPPAIFFTCRVPSVSTQSMPQLRKYPGMPYDQLAFGSVRVCVRACVCVRTRAPVRS